MNLTVGEYCLFNLRSRTSLLERNGTLLFRKRVDERHEIKLFQIFDFYVEVLWDIRKTKAITIEPVKGQQWLGFYLFAPPDPKEVC
jgi:hypothetical protein